MDNSNSSFKMNFLPGFYRGSYKLRNIYELDQFLFFIHSYNVPCLVQDFEFNHCLHDSTFFRYVVYLESDKIYHFAESLGFELHYLSVVDDSLNFDLSNYFEFGCCFFNHFETKLRKD